MAGEEVQGQGIERVAATLKALGQGPRGGMRLMDVVAATGLSKTTAHRTLAGLARVGYVDQDAEAGTFHLGFELFALGIAAADRHGLIHLADESLSRLASRTADTVFLSTRSGSESICLARREGSFPIRALTLDIGDRRPLGVGAGSLALLASLSDDEIDAALKRAEPALAAYPGYTPSSIFHMVEETRRQGFSFNCGTIIPEMWAVGVPVLDPQGRPVASLSVAAIRSRLDEERRANVVAWLSAEARHLAERVAALAERIEPAGGGAAAHTLLKRALGVDGRAGSIKQ